MTRFVTLDQCSLKADTNLIGTVERTHSDLNTHEPLDDVLIIAHVPVNPNALKKFLLTGAPERGFVFVAWADEALGHSLVAESQLNLLNRPMIIGNTVKRHAEDAMIGTVISVSENYTLQPVCWEDAEGSFSMQGNIAAPDGTNQGEKAMKDHNCQCGPACQHSLPASVSHRAPHRLLFDISGDELKKADDFSGGDYVICQNWLGEVREAITDVIVRLEDGSIVLVDDSAELELLVVDSGKPLVALPEPDGFKKPDIISYSRGLATIPPSHLNRGQFVVTNNRNLLRGRWISGKPSNAPAQGEIVDIRTRMLDVRWLVPNIQVDWGTFDRPPASAIRVYENLSTFRNPRELRIKKDVLSYDRGRRPSTANTKSAVSINQGQVFRAGNHVKFRDISAAAVKYQHENGRHGSLRRIPREAFEGFDMNEFKIVCSHQVATVQWQDGQNSQESSTSLQPYSAPVFEICPGEIVALKEETEQISRDDPRNGTTTYNEIQYLQGGYDLRLRKVGVVQSVDAVERLARVRWFSNSHVELLHQGDVFKAGSYLGPISDEVEETSLYEIMTHPALVRHRREIVLLPGGLDVSSKAMARPWPGPMAWMQTGICSLSFLRPWHFETIFDYLYGAVDPITIYNGIPIDISKNRNQDDWVGEIVDLGLDGLITIRLGATSDCREVRVPLQMILMIVDSPAYEPIDDTISGGSDFDQDPDDWMSDESPIEEIIEYEGGQRLDDDSGDEMWSTDEDSETASTDSAYDGDILMPDLSRDDLPKPAEASTGEDTAPLGKSQVRSSNTISPSILAFAGATSEPSQFDVISDPLPSDCFALNVPAAPMSSNGIRRIRKEHKILLTSLPPNIYVRSYESRLDVLRCLIIGPENTPYEYAPFVIDLLLPLNFPNSPPVAHFHSWTYGLGRINPNLYEEGKICLSLLNTWWSKSQDEKWSEKSSILQILVSIMGLVLVKNPFFNEAGFDTFERQGEYGTEARLYTEKVFVMARGFVKHALTKGVEGMQDVLAWNYVRKPSGQTGNEDSKHSSTQEENMLSKVISRAQALIQHANSVATSNTVPASSPSSSEQSKPSAPPSSAVSLTDGTGDPSSSEAFLPPLSKGAIAMLRKHIAAVESMRDEATSNNADPAESSE